eukprot:3922844-Amphidinium_carterae.1
MSNQETREANGKAHDSSAAGKKARTAEALTSINMCLRLAADRVQVDGLPPYMKRITNTLSAAPPTKAGRFERTSSFCSGNVCK